jgi:hypothetical protein
LIFIFQIINGAGPEKFVPLHDRVFVERLDQEASFVAGLLINMKAMKRDGDSGETEPEPDQSVDV